MDFCQTQDLTYKLLPGRMLQWKYGGSEFHTNYLAMKNVIRVFNKILESKL